MMKSKKELFRNEWKYLISVGEKELLRLRMSPFLHLDPHADEGGYMIRSLYFDDYWNSAYEGKRSWNSDDEKNIVSESIIIVTDP